MSNYSGNNGNQTNESINNNGIDKFSNRERQQVYERTQAGVENLKRSTIDSSLNTASTKSDLTVEQTGLQYERDIHTLVGFLSVLDNLLEEVKDTRKGLSKKGLSKAGQKTIDEAKTKLKQYEKQLKGKKKTILKQASREITDNEIGELRKLWQNLNEVRNDIGMGQWGYFSSTASYLYNSPETTRKSNKHQADNLEFNQDFQEELKEGAISTIFNGNVQNANAFLRRIAQGEYTAADYQLYITNSTTFNPYFQKYQIAIPTNPHGTIGGIEQTGDSRSTRRSVDYSNMDWGDTFQQGGVAGVIDKLLTNCSNMSPGQKDTRKTLGVLGIIGGVIYGQYKFYTSKKIGRGTKIGLTILPIFGSQVLTGDDPITLFKKLMTGGLSIDELKNKFGNAVGGLSASGSEAAETTVPAMQSMMIFNSGATAGDVQQMTQTFINDKSNNNRRNFYQQSCDKIQREGGALATESFQAIFSEDFDEEKRKNWLASFGITGSTSSSETVHNLAENANTNKVILERFLSDNNLKITTDPTKKAELDAYIKGKNEKNKSIKINDLKAHTDRFITNNPDNQNPAQQNNNPQNPDQQDNQEIELKSSSLKGAVERGLSKSFNTLKSKCPRIVRGFLSKKLNKIKDGQSEEIANDIICHVLNTNGRTITIDISDNNIKQVYDQCFNRIYKDSGELVRPLLKGYDWNGLESKFKTGENDKFDNRKDNLTKIFESIFGEIIPELQSKSQNIEIICHGKKFNTINDAVKTLHIINPYKH